MSTILCEDTGMMPDTLVDETLRVISQSSSETGEGLMSDSNVYP